MYVLGMNISKLFLSAFCALCAVVPHTAFSQSVQIDSHQRTVDLVNESWIHFMDIPGESDYYFESVDAQASWSGDHSLGILDASASAVHSSLVSETRMMGDATVLAQTGSDSGSYTHVTAVAQSDYLVEFTVTESITISIIGELYSSGDDRTEAQMRLLEVGVGNVFEYETDVGAYLVDEFFVLEPGSYRFTAGAGTVRESNGTVDLFGEARYSFDLNVVPTPSGMMLLAGGGLFAARRRRS
jgi:hypothetical protein